MLSAAFIGRLSPLAITVCLGCTPLAQPSTANALHGNAADLTIDAVSVPRRLTLPEIIERAQAEHPTALATRRRIEQADAAIDVASDPSNPELVLDVDTSLRDEPEQTELSARVTFPLDFNNRRWRRRVAESNALSARMDHRQAVRALREAALLSAIEVSYLSQRLVLDEQRETIAKERSRILNPATMSESGADLSDTAQRLRQYTDAIEAAEAASQARFETRRDLVHAKTELAEAMGMDLSEDPGAVEHLQVDEALLAHPDRLPALDDVVNAAVQDSARIDAARQLLRTRRLTTQAERHRWVPSEAGPRYDDRLGSDDDRIGFRFQTDLPIHDLNLNRSRVASFDAKYAEADLARVRNEVASQTMRDYQELTILNERLDEIDTGPSIEAQRAQLESPAVADILTVEERLALEETLLRRQRRRLDMRYRHARIRSRLRLHAVMPHIGFSQSLTEPIVLEAPGAYPEPRS
ncbi:MAG: TolC family protein [Planctomycetota bacterium]